MLFNSYIFLIFFPIVVCVYFILPVKIRRYWLLLASYYFYMSWNAKYALLILFSTVVTWLTGIFLDRQKNASGEGSQRTARQKLVFWGCIAANLGILFFFKYFNFFSDSLRQLFLAAGIELSVPVFDVILPVGISFYTFQALGYCIDIYRGEIDAENNFFKYALFVSFFPQLVAGPIERSKNLLTQLDTPKPFSGVRLREGIFLMLWGFFQKIVIADRIGLYVNTVFNQYNDYKGAYLVVAAVLFAFQVYGDFAGYSNIAKGAACILGIDLMDNFSSPFLSRTCAEFWRRWHISLSTWFRDYVYIPLGGNRKGRFRKHLNLLVVFGLSGLWHGANWTYVLWGFLNGVFQVVGDLLTNAKKRFCTLFGIHPEKPGSKLAQIVITFTLIDFSLIIFRANSINDAVQIIDSIASVFNPWILFDDSLYGCGLSAKGFLILAISLLLLFVVDIANYKGIKVRRILLEQDYWFRVLAFAFSVAFILIFGIWGTGYESDAFLYFQF